MARTHARTYVRTHARTHTRTEGTIALLLIISSFENMIASIYIVILEIKM